MDGCTSRECWYPMFPIPRLLILVLALDVGDIQQPVL